MLTKTNFSLSGKITWILTILLVGFIPSNLYGQSKSVSGVVSDGNTPMPGVYVLIKGTQTGTSTDLNGKYTLDVPNNSSILVFSFIGYLSHEELVGSNTVLNITMKEEYENLEEVVVIGYGVQKKINLSGAVQAISGKELESRPVSNTNYGLQGLVSNLNVGVTTGRADDAPSLNIRGFTSINGGDAFILVDNVPVSSAELARINPDDIESVSVLKDASSAAIYGARAAFGVVLITTKKAKSDQLNVNFSANYAIRDRGISPKIVTDLETVMRMKNDARRPLSLLYSNADFEYAKKIAANPSLPRVITSPDDPNKWSYYGETDWINEAYENSAPTYTANINISKRDKVLSYYVSAGYYQQDGLLRYGNDQMKRYNFRASSDLKLVNWWKVGTNISYINTNYDSPSFLDGHFFWNINRTASTFVPRNPDGTWTNQGAGVLGAVSEGGRRLDRTNETQLSFTTELNLIKDIWKVNADVNFRRTNFNRDKNAFVVPYRIGPNQPIQYNFNERGDGIENPMAELQARENNFDVFNFYTNFTKTFAKKHYFNVMFGYNREYLNTRYYKVTKTNLITESLPEINLATGTTTALNERRELALEGVFGRFNYIFDDKYIIEFNGRYDGSSRFPDGDRRGFFPSGSLAWIVNREGFMQSISETLKISNLKLRGSYGVLGNQVSEDYYPYIAYMESGQSNVILDGKKPLKMNQPGVVSKSLTWEKVRTINGGVDLGLFNGRFDLSFDIYTRYTEDMLTASKQLPGVFGAKPPRTNAADLKTNGWELTVSWRDRFELLESPFQWSVKLIIADSRSYITRYDNPRKSIKNLDAAVKDREYYEGQEIGEIWGFTNDGFFQNEEELKVLDQKEVGTDDQNYKFYVGDTRFKDFNNDDAITFGDNTVDKPGDRKIIGNSSIRYPYSFEMSAAWKGFDLRLFFQGVGKRDWYPPAANIYFWGIYAQPWTNVTEKNMDHWTPENRDAYFPRVKSYIAEDKNEELGAPQTKYLQNASYLRLKNLTVGYSLPKNLLEKIRLSSLRVYFSAENLFTINKLDVKLDPEIVDKGGRGAYPMQKIYSFGLNLTF